MDTESFKVLEYEKITNWLASFASSIRGKERCRRPERRAPRQIGTNIALAPFLLQLADHSAEGEKENSAEKDGSDHTVTLPFCDSYFDGHLMRSLSALNVPSAYLPTATI